MIAVFLVFFDYPKTPLARIALINPKPLNLGLATSFVPLVRVFDPKLSKQEQIGKSAASALDILEFRLFKPHQKHLLKRYI